MELHWTDVALFVGFIGFVLAFSMYKGRREQTSEDYFLASRSLIWPIIGMSLIAANISTEQFVGMNGSAAGNVGLAISAYDWIAAVSLVFVAIFFLPRLLRTGVYTVPEYLEYRFNAAARGIMSFYMMVIYVAVTISAVLYSGGLTIATLFDVELTKAVWLVGVIAAIYTTYGGLKSVAWADLFLGTALIGGGFCVLIAGLDAVGGWRPFLEHNAGQLHLGLAADHPELPWTALLLGIWIPNLYYWGFNQYIVQRTLAAKTLKQGQLGVLLAAAIQVVLPLIIVVPGIIAVQLYGPDLPTQDAAFPTLIRRLLPAGLRGFIFASIAGAVISSLASMLNSASTIFTMDVFTRHLKKDASPRLQVRVGRVMTLVFVVIGCLIAPCIGDPRFRGVFHYIQDFQGYASPGILACFLFGFFVKRASGAAAVTGLLLNVVVYGILHLNTTFLQAIGIYGRLPWFDAFASLCENTCFLNKMAITFIVIVAVMTAITLLRPLEEPKEMRVREGFDAAPAPSVVWLGTAIIAVVAALYVSLW